VGTNKATNDFIIKNYPCGIKGYDRHGRPLYFKQCVDLGAGTGGCWCWCGAGAGGGSSNR
jgi:hypothetical protein